MELKFKRPFAVAAHRGDRAHKPENTMAAFISALEKGVDMIETDVRITADDQLVLIHDAKVDRTTNDTGLVRDRTYEELKKLNAGTEENPQYVPLFEELLQLLQDHPEVFINVELKEYYDGTNAEYCKAFVAKVMAMMEKYNMRERCVMNSFDGFLLECVHETHPEYLLHGFYPYTIMRNVNVCPAEYLYCACIMEPENEELYQYLKEHNIRTWVGANVREQHQVDAAIRLGAELVTTDDPALTLSQIAASK